MSAAGDLRRELSPAQRAAIIIAVLGEQAARPIVERLDDAELSRVAEALREVGFLDRDDVLSVVMDFLDHLRRADGAFRGGEAQARELMSNLIAAPRLAAVFGEQEATEPAVDRAGDAQLWSQVETADPIRLAEFLNGLNPKVVAIILTKLGVAATAKILLHIDDAKIQIILGEMVDGTEVDPDVVKAIEKLIAAEFLNTARGDKGDRDEQFEAVGEILSLIPGDKRDSLLAFLREEHATALERIETSLMTIDAIPTIVPPKEVQVLFREMDQGLLKRFLLSLNGPFNQISEFLMGSISSRMADQWRFELEGAPAPSEDEAEAAQGEFLANLMTLKRRGTIKMSGGS